MVGETLPHFTNPKFFDPFLVGLNPFWPVGGFHPPILGDGPPKKGGWGRNLLPSVLFRFFFWPMKFRNLSENQEDKNGWLMSFFVRACWGITTTTPLIFTKKHPSWCFVWFERSQLRDFAEQSINRDHVGIPWSWQFDKYIGFFSTGELELRSWERCGQFSSNRPCGPCVCYLLGLVLPSLVNQVS